MTTPGHTEKVDTTASVAHSQGQAPLRDVTKKPAQQGTPIQTEIVDEESEPQSATAVSACRPAENATQHPVKSPQNPIMPYSESMPSLAQRAKDIVAVCANSSVPGTLLEISPLSQPYEQPPPDNLSTPKDTVGRLSHQSTPPEITEEPHGIANIFSSTSASEDLNRKGFLKGRPCFRFVVQAVLTW